MSAARPPRQGGPAGSLPQQTRFAPSPGPPDPRIRGPLVHQGGLGTPQRGYPPVSGPLPGSLYQNPAYTDSGDLGYFTGQAGDGEPGRGGVTVGGQHTPWIGGDDEESIPLTRGWATFSCLQCYKLIDADHPLVTTPITPLHPSPLPLQQVQTLSAARPCPSAGRQPGGSN